ncbi:MAG TPA: electron transfer flavoprotein subunit alpha/FixB family protein, partial [Alphaproteobacteria bacterium]|nr:electron transfer flavoprotein subunit alpha/FixB family protein [Alphaproteobacteria bacterium]
MSVLVIAEHDHKSIKPVTLNVITAARKIDSDVHVLVAGTDCGAAADAAAKIHGITKVLKCDAPELSHRLAENVAPVVVGLADGYTHILAPATTFGKNVSPRIAALLDTQQ